MPIERTTLEAETQRDLNGKEHRPDGKGWFPMNPSFRKEGGFPSLKMLRKWEGVDFPNTRVVLQPTSFLTFQHLRNQKDTTPVMSCWPLKECDLNLNSEITLNLIFFVAYVDPLLMHLSFLVSIEKV
ncbi:hypothetical protein TNCT_301681 [Trichonephila clavata]|uniref:Uncharacterized protein n=1 Tax=Trichonephila clavata TaxID=2740835 RepID=A0A8X6L3W2_TRICU|nr:hypothetical protein TNCT_301681 [Trichonephila clavata]